MRMKGSSMFGDMFMLFVLIVMMLLISAMLWAVVMSYALGQRADRDVKMEVFEYPVKNDGTLLAFLETTHDGVPMRNLISLAAMEKNHMITYNGKSYDLKILCDLVLDQAMIDYYRGIGGASKKYMLKLNTEPEIILATNGEIRSDDKVVVKIFGIDDSYNLEFYVD